MLAVADADHRAGQGVDVFVLGVDLGLRRRRDADARGVDAAQLVENAHRVAVGVEQAEGVGPLQAELEDPRAGHFHHLHFQHHFRVGLILGLQQFLGHAHGIGGVAHGQGIETLVDEYVAGLEHGLDQVQCSVGIDAGQVEGTHHQFLVILGLLWRVRVDQQGVVVHHLLVQLVLLQQQGHGVFDTHVTDEDGCLHVRAQVLVEDEVQPRHLRQHLEDGLQVGVAKFQGHRPFELAAQLWVGPGGAALHQLDVLAQGQAAFVLRVEQQHFAHVPLGAEQIAPTQRRLAQGDALAKIAHLFDLAYRIQGPAVVRLQGQHPAVAAARTAEIMAAAVAVGLGQQRFDCLAPALDQGDVQLGVARVLLERFFELSDPGLILPFTDQGLGVLAHTGGAATGQGDTQGKHQVRRFVAEPWQIHGALPTDKVWDRCNGR
ncbi:hypothetical protein D3C79_697390 [compost metagenome]